VKERNEYYKQSKVPVIGGVTAVEHAFLQQSSTLRSASLSNSKVEGIAGASIYPQDRVGNVSNSGVPSPAGWRGGELRQRESGQDQGSNKRSSAHPRLRKRWWTSETAEIDSSALERPYVLYFAIQERLRKRMTEGGLDVPPPIAAVMWEDLLCGWRAFEYCRYLLDTPFPFPWAQMIIFALVLWQFLVPFATVVCYDNWALGTAMCAFTIWILWAVNEVSRAIEDPFVATPNDLPLARLQHQFNEKLLAIVSPDIGILVASMPGDEVDQQSENIQGEGTAI